MAFTWPAPSYPRYQIQSSEGLKDEGDKDTYSVEPPYSVHPLVLPHNDLIPFTQKSLEAGSPGVKEPPCMWAHAQVCVFVLDNRQCRVCLEPHRAHPLTACLKQQLSMTRTIVMYRTLDKVCTDAAIMLGPTPGCRLGRSVTPTPLFSVNVGGLLCYLVIFMQQGCGSALKIIPESSAFPSRVKIC